MQIIVNDEPVEIRSGESLLDTLEEISVAKKNGIAVAVNECVVAREDWQNFVLKSGDTLLIITATQGG